MKAALITGLNQLEIRDVSAPVIPEGGVILKMISAAVCGTDIKMIANGHRDLILPRIPGHEGIGTVIESENPGFKHGDVLAVYPGIYCGKCLNCIAGNTSRCESIKIYGFNQDGLFRELVPFSRNEISSLILVSGGNNIENIALAEPLACCISALNKVNVKKGSALIIGAGSIGIIFAALLLSKGFSEVVITDRSGQRLNRQIPSNVSVIESDTEYLGQKLAAEGLNGFDLIVPCCPDGLKWPFTRFINSGGAAILFSGNNRGLESDRVDMNDIHYKEIVLAGSYGCNASDFLEAVRMLTSGEIDLSFLTPQLIELKELPESLNMLKESSIKKIIINRF